MAKSRRNIPLIELMRQQYPDYGKKQLRAFIDCRQVMVEGETCVDSRKTFPLGTLVELSIPKYVSRGGLKLEHALHAWDIDVSHLVMVDAGSSTGGFTDCLLQHGAATVHAVDVGYNQLDYRLRSDDRVIVHERTNIMLVTNLAPQPDGAVADLSFRSITGAASHILSLTKGSWMVSLIKPQFEIPKDTEGFTGVVDDSATLASILLDVYDRLASEQVGISRILESPITGRKGNREFLALLHLGIQMDRETFDRALSDDLSLPH